MSDKFDPYHKWLGIPAQEQPPNHYRLLAIPVFEQDGDVISNAADRQMAHLRTFQSGAHSADSQRLLNEASAARKCLLTPAEKAAYDQQLKLKLQAATAAPSATPGSSTKIARTRPASAESTSSKVSSADKSEIKQRIEKPKPLEQEAEFDIVTDRASTGSSSSIRRAASSGATAGTASQVSGRRKLVPKGERGKSKNQVWMLTVGGALAVVLIVALGIVLSSGEDSPEKLANNPTRPPQSGEKPKVNPATFPALNTKPVSESNPESANPSRSTVPALTHSVNLLEKINHERDKIEGNWSRSGNELIAPAANYARLEIPLALPASYLLTFVATWTAGETNLCLGLPIEDRQVMLKIDQGGPSKFTGLDLIDGKPANENSTSSHGPFLRPAVPNTIHCAVSPGEIRAYCNGSEIVRWQGKSQQLSLSDRWATRDRHHGFIGGWNSSFRVQKLEVGPLPSNFKPVILPELPTLTQGRASGLAPEALAARFARGEEIDLLKLIDPRRDAVTGIWNVVDGTLVTPNVQYAKLQIQQSVPKEYEWVVVAQRISGSEALNLGISIGGRRAVVLLDGQNGRTSGLEEIDHKRFMSNETVYAKPIFADGAAHEIVCTVTENSVCAMCDGKQLFEWHGNPEKLTLNATFLWPDPTCLCLGSFGTPFKISRVVLRSIASASTLAEKTTPRSLPNAEIPTTQPKPAGTRWAIPSETEISAGLREIKSKHSELYASAQRLEGKLPLAEMLMQQARRRQAAAAVQYVLLTQVTEYAADVAEAKLALEACRVLAEQFEVDGKMLEASALASCVRGIKTNSQRHDLTMQCLAVLAEAASQDHYLAAVEFANAAFTASAKSDDLELKKLARAHRDHIRTVQTAWEKVAPAAQLLTSDPMDSAANLEVGRFRCFWQADWQRGLPLLAKGSDPVLRSLAAADLKDPEKSTDRLRLGEDWWEFGEKQPMPSRLIVQDRAAFWFTLGLTAEATGIQRTRTESRLAKFKTLRDTAGPLFARASHPTDAVMFGKHWYKMFTDRLSWDEAKTECEKLGGYLVCIESPEENLFVKSLAIGSDNNARRRVPYWLGASDVEQERVFRWVNGSQSFYADWKTGEPNNSGGSEHYVGVMPTNFGLDIVSAEQLKWNDYAARERFCYVCEWDR
jgi:hypothetical protein